MKAWLPPALQPLRVRAYRRLALALSASMLASGVWMVAMVWQVIAIGGGPTEVALIATTTTVVAVAVMLLGGVLADRVPQKRIMLGAHCTHATAFAVVAMLTATGQAQVWHMVLAAAVIGAGGAFAFPAYSAWVPALVEPDQLLAVNGIEGVLRPTMIGAVGPAVAGLVIGLASPEAAIAVAAAASLVAWLATTAVPRTPVRRDDAPASPGLAGMLRDVRGGARYVVGTRWLAVTLPMASLMVFAIMGPLYVVLPFLLRDDLGLGAGAHASVIAAFGIGGAMASLFVASLRFPRRYLSAIVAMWGAIALPLLAIGLAGHLVVVLIAAFVLGGLFSAPNTIWGTVLQRRVPPALIGRVSSLDFMVSNTFTPASQALAGPLALALGASGVFLLAAALTPVALVVVLLVGRLAADEDAHPLRATDADVPKPVDTAPG